MINAKNLKTIFLALLLAAVMPVLCMASGKGHNHVKHGTRVNVGAHADLGGNTHLRLIIYYINPSNNPITIKEIKIYKPDGTLASPNFALDSFPVPPFDLGPFESNGFALIATGVQPVSFQPRGVFQVHTDWESEGNTIGLKSHSVIVGFTDNVSGSITRFAIEGYDIKNKKSKDDGSSDH
jgi:hypothetical protein